MGFVLKAMFGILVCSHVQQYGFVGEAVFE